MSLGENIQYLRQINNITQEALAESLSVSRQTISKWETNQVYPEIPKLIEMGKIFHCKLDELLNEDIRKMQEAYSEIVIKKVDAFRMARYVMITPNPEDDVNAYMDKWEMKSGLHEIPGYESKRIGWDFPFVSPEQQTRFGMRGYVSACILPEGFEPKCQGTEIVSQESANYACITIRDPFSIAFELIPGAYKKILKYLGANGFKETTSGDFISCFEHVYEKDGVCYMEVYIHTDAVGQANLHTF